MSLLGVQGGPTVAHQCGLLRRRAQYRDLGLCPGSHGDQLHERGILYAPDYVINAGGIINVASELDGVYRPERARELTERIYDTVGQVISTAREDGIPTYLAADLMAERRLDSVRKLREVRR